MLLVLIWRTVKDSESILLVNVLDSFTVKYFVSREEILSKKKKKYLDQGLGLL